LLREAEREGAFIYNASATATSGERPGELLNLAAGLQLLFTFHQHCLGQSVVMGTSRLLNDQDDYQRHSACEEQAQRHGSQQ
jgi:hypothetical protein